MLLVEGKKMSKSLGNFFTVRDLLDQGVPGDVIRFVFLMTHYRKPMDWTEGKRLQAENEIERWVDKLRFDPEVMAMAIDDSLVDGEVIAALSDDLNTSAALSRLVRMGRYIDNDPSFLNMDESDQIDAMRSFIATASILGFSIPAMVSGRKNPDADMAVLTMYERELARHRANKDWSSADAVRDALLAASVKVSIGRDGSVLLEPSPNFNPAKLEALK
jgi:cysteinyl-tRNA synthetase